MSPLSDGEIRRICKAMAGTPRDEPQEPWASAFLRHPAVLLLLGFLATGVVGSWLTAKWNSREWANQQNYLLRQRALEKRYALIDELFTAVATTNTAAEDVLAGYSWSWKPGEVKQRRAKWLEESRNWRISSKVIAQKLGTYFSNPGVVSGFEDIVDRRRRMGNIITNLLNDGYDNETKAKAERATAEGLVQGMPVALNKCGQIMAQELRAE